MKKLLLILLCVPLMFSCTVSFDDDNDDDNENDSKIESYTEVTAQELYSEFTSDNESASETYNNKKIKITGTLEKNIKKGRGGTWYVTLKVKQRFGSVMCHFQKDFNKEDFSNYSINDEVTLIGKCDSYNTMVMVKNCDLFNE